ncbi:MAG: diphthine--ammonia ligase [Methanomicrobia archaeon]|nr:diphthine--ammonia ligase [Methanomicrobia archaeon]
MAQLAKTNGTVAGASEKRKKGNVVASWTGGKDGCFACYNALLDGFNVTHLLNFKDLKKHAPHNLNHDVLAAQSEAMGVPIIQREFVSYEAEFKKVIRTLNENGAEIKGAIFGHIGMHEHLVQRICSDLDIESIMPLWNRDSEQLVTDFIAAGFEAIVITTKADLMGKEWLGRTINEEFVAQLRTFNSAIDPCGEFGEFHSLVIDGPLFKNRIELGESEPILEDGYWRLDIFDYTLGEKKRDTQ